jgi:plasmid stability protein
MPVNLSIKNAPDEIVQRLRERAERHHRSLQGELMAIIEAAVRADRPASPAEILAEVRRLGVRTPGEADAAGKAAALERLLAHRVKPAPGTPTSVELLNLIYDEPNE